MRTSSGSTRSSSARWRAESSRVSTISGPSSPTSCISPRCRPCASRPRVRRAARPFTSAHGDRERHVRQRARHRGRKDERRLQRGRESDPGGRGRLRVRGRAGRQLRLAERDGDAPVPSRLRRRPRSTHSLCGQRPSQRVDLPPRAAEGPSARGGVGVTPGCGSDSAVRLQSHLRRRGQRRAGGG